MSITENIASKIRPIYALGLAILIVISFNTKESIKDIRHNLSKGKLASDNFLGKKFEGLESILENQKYIGYITDKDFDNPQHAAQFAQAQYVLAPSVLDVNNPEHEFLIFDYSDPKQAVLKIKELKAVPLKVNPYGIFLVHRAQEEKSP